MNDAQRRSPIRGKLVLILVVYGGELLEVQLVVVIDHLVGGVRGLRHINRLADCNENRGGELGVLFISIWQGITGPALWLWLPHLHATYP